MTSEDLFKRLVDNAFDFLARAIEDLRERPKHSVINFYAAVELFLKARLMKEHWSLVVSKRQEPEWERFVAGDFVSVSLDEAAQRLTKVVKSGLTPAEYKEFQEVSRHRNKMVHFFHEADSREEGEALRAAIVKQQLIAWYFLNGLLAERWVSTFEEWSREVDATRQRLKGHHAYLEVTYDHKRPEIEADKASGTPYTVCPSCGFEAQKHNDLFKAVYSANCVVCDLEQKCLRIACPKCSEVVTFRNDGFATCASCGEEFEPQNLVDALIDEGAAHIAAKDGDDSWDLGNCADCEGYHTVVRTENDEYICASCLGVFESLDVCGWCNEPNTGDMDDSTWNGCSHCDGRAGWEKDD